MQLLGKLIIKSKNKIFRPSDLGFGLDGALYISDFYYPIIGHAQHSIRDKNRDYANGRIWRVTKKDSPLLKSPKLTDRSASDLLSLLKDDLLRVRQLARVELENLDQKDVLEAIKSQASSIETNDSYALEILWLYERLKNFEDTKIIRRLVKSDNINVKRAATRSLRWWKEPLGSDFVPILTSLAKESDARVHVALISVISHLQRSDESLSEVINVIQAKPKSPVSILKEMASWKDLPSIAAEFPLLKVDPKTFVTQWLGKDLKKEGTLYFESDTAQELIVGHSQNPHVNIDINDVPLLRSSGNVHAKDSQNNFLVKKGINKVRFFTSGKSKKPARIYITDKTGRVPQSVTYAAASEQAEMAKVFDSQQALQWKEFAQHTFSAHCATCHMTNGNRAVGPALNGLFGKKQTVLDTKGNKSTITIDEAYIRKAILDPTSLYPEGYPPLMPKIDLSTEKVDNLVRWIKHMY